MANLVRGLGLPLEERQVLVAGGGSFQLLWRNILSSELKSRLTVTSADPLLGAARMAIRKGSSL